MDKVVRKLPILSIHDNLVGYKNVFIEQNEAVSVRGFKNSIKRVLESGDYLDNDPADLSLYKLGYLDLDSGDIEAFAPVALIHGTAVITEWNIDKCNHCDCTCSKEEGE